MKTAKKQAPTIASVLAELEKDGVKLGSLEVSEPKWYTTCNMAIDAKLGGGIAVGKIVEFAGPNASGKTTTAGSTAANIMAEGGIVAFFDFERSLDKPYFQTLGVDVDNKDQFLYFTPRTLEDGANILRALLKTGELDLAIMDSVARMVTQTELDAPTGTVTVMDKAKMLYQFCRQVVDDLADTDCTLIFINHLLEKVDMTFAGRQAAARGIKNYTTPGGNAIPFFASQRLFFEKKGNIYAQEIDPVTNTETKTAIGYNHLIRVAKNKVGKPEGVINVVNILGEGFSQTRTAMEILKSYGYVEQNASWFNVSDERLIEHVGAKKYQGEESLYRALTEDPAARGTMISIARELLNREYESLVEAAE